MDSFLIKFEPHNSNPLESLTIWQKKKTFMNKELSKFQIHQSNRYSE